MTSAVNFTVDGLPIAKARPRFARVGKFVRTYQPKKTESYEAWARGCAEAAMEGRKMLLGACRINVAFILPVPSSWPAWKREAALKDHVKPTAPPDLDNMLKSIKDACNTVVFKDDRQIVEVATAKLYGETPEARVVVTPIETIASAVEWKLHLRSQMFVPESAGDLFVGAA